MFKSVRTALAVGVALVALLASAIPASAGSTSITSGSCVGAGSTYRYANQAVGTTLHTQGSSCYKTVDFAWWAPDGTGWVYNSTKSGYGTVVQDSIGIGTDAMTTHSMSNGFGTTWAFTNSWT